jgi:tungstate transport system ATP-binding protein
VAELVYEAEDLIQVYNGRQALNLPRLAVPPGSVTALTGVNGSGKSTLLRILAFLEVPASGRLSFLGRPCPWTRDNPRREATLLLQEPYLLRRSVLSNVLYGLRVRGVAAREAGERAAEALLAVGLPPERFARRDWRELSGGEAQRVALAARLALKPRVLLLDEPTASLDTGSAELVCRAALSARDAWGAAIVVASHDRAWLDRVADREIRLGCPEGGSGPDQTRREQEINQ